MNSTRAQTDILTQTRCFGDYEFNRDLKYLPLPTLCWISFSDHEFSSGLKLARLNRVKRTGFSNQEFNRALKPAIGTCGTLVVLATMNLTGVLSSENLKRFCSYALLP